MLSPGLEFYTLQEAKLEQELREPEVHILPTLWARASGQSPSSPFPCISVQLREVELASVFDKHLPPQFMPTVRLSMPTLTP